VAAAIETVSPQPGIDRIIEIAFFERVNPRKGFELILANYGTCKAISTFLQYPDRKGREDCIGLLVRRLHGDLLSNLKRAISTREREEPETQSIPDLIRGRDWLFEDNSYYVDTSHLVSVLGFSLELTEPETLALALELTEYGPHLSSLFQYRSDPPFENVYADHAMYLGALLGQNVEQAIAHFRQKAAECDPNQMGSRPAQMLIELLVRLRRYAEAIEASLQYLRNVDSTQLGCPSIPQLCQLAGEYGQLMRLAREEGNLLNFTAAVLQAGASLPTTHRV
jgi:hypothetical protein